MFAAGRQLKQGISISSSSKSSVPSSSSSPRFASVGEGEHHRQAQTAPFTSPAPTPKPAAPILPSSTCTKRMPFGRSVAALPLPTFLGIPQLPPSLVWSCAVIVGTGFLGLLAWLDAKLKEQKPKLQYADTEFNQAVLEQCPSLHETYKPLPFFTNRHAVSAALAAAAAEARPCAAPRHRP